MSTRIAVRRTSFALGLVLAGGTGGGAATHDEQPTAQFRAANAITDFEVAQTGGVVVTASAGGVLSLLDSATLEVRHSVDLGAAPPQPTSRPLSTTESSTREDGRRAARPEEPLSVRELAVSEDGRRVAVRTADGRVRCWNPDPGKIWDLAVAASAIAFHADSHELVIADERGDLILRSRAGTMRRYTFSDERKIEGVELSRDGRVVAFALDDG